MNDLGVSAVRFGQPRFVAGMVPQVSAPVVGQGAGEAPAEPFQGLSGDEVRLLEWMFVGASLFIRLPVSAVFNA